MIKFRDLEALINARIYKNCSARIIDSHFTALITGREITRLEKTHILRMTIRGGVGAFGRLKGLG